MNIIPKHCKKPNNLSEFLTGLSVTAGKSKMLIAFKKSKEMHKAVHAFFCHKIKTGFGARSLHLSHIAIVKEEWVIM